MGIHRHDDSKCNSSSECEHQPVYLSLTNNLAVQECWQTISRSGEFRRWADDGSSGWQGQTMAECRMQATVARPVACFICARHIPATYMISRSNSRPHTYFSLFLPLQSATMIFLRASLALLVVSIAALFCAQSVEAAKGPKITHKVYFDIKQGDENLGRSTCHLFHYGARPDPRNDCGCSL